MGHYSLGSAPRFSPTFHSGDQLRVLRPQLLSDEYFPSVARMTDFLVNPSSNSIQNPKSSKTATILTLFGSTCSEV